MTMNKLSAAFFAAAVTLSCFSGARALAADDKNYLDFTIDWSQPRLSDSGVLLCDDNQWSGVSIAVPGQNVSIYSVAFKDCGADWKLVKKQNVRSGGKVFTNFIFEGSSACSLQIDGPHERGADHKVFTIDLSDAC